MCQILNPRSLGLTVLLLAGVSQPAFAAETDSNEKKPAVVIVRLPADAELIIAGVKSKQRTAVREFDTPPLPPGQKFSYIVKGVWQEGENEVTRETTIVVKAGETTAVNLLELKLAPPHAEKITIPEIVPEKETKPEPEKKPDTKPEPKKKPESEPKPEEKKPESKPEPEKKPSLQPEPEKKPEPPSPPAKKTPQPPAVQGTLALLMPQTLTLQPGATKLLPIKVVRTHCEGPVRIVSAGLPPDVTLAAAVVAADRQKCYVKVSASANAPEKEWEVKIVGISGSVRQESALTIRIAR